MLATDYIEFTEVDRIRQKYERMYEEKLLRDAMKDSGEMKHTLYEMLKGILLLAATALFCLIAIYWQTDILNFFRTLLNK